jgi:hypothetical protein
MELDQSIRVWESSIISRMKDNNFRSCTCKIYNRQAGTSDNSDTLCACGRLVRSHSFDDECIQPKEGDPERYKWSPPQRFSRNHYATDVPVTVFGRLKSNGCKFIRLDDQSKMSVVYNLLVNDCGGEDHKPSLILSVYGGAKYFTLTERLEKKIIRGIIAAATTAST